MDVQPNTLAHSCQYAQTYNDRPDNTDMHKDMSTIIVALLDRRKLSQNGLAKLCGISQPTLSRIISGEQQPKKATLMAMARYLGVRVSQLIGEEPIDYDDPAAEVLRIMQDMPDYKRSAILGAAKKLSEDP
jgi:transcriptional regulator with XRE-family HTH domain